MRTVTEILQAAKQRQPLAPAEARQALLVLGDVEHQLRHALWHLVHGVFAAKPDTRLQARAESADEILRATSADMSSYVSDEPPPKKAVAATRSGRT